MNVNAGERLDEPGAVLFQLRGAGCRRINRSHALVERLFLRLDTDFTGIDTRNSEFQMHEFVSGNMLQFMSHIHALAYRRMIYIGNVHVFQDILKVFF